MSLPRNLAQEDKELLSAGIVEGIYLTIVMSHGLCQTYLSYECLGLGKAGL